MAGKVLDANAMEWKRFPDAAVEYKVLRRHGGGGGVTMLLRFPPGTAYAPHRHPDGEEYYVLEGTLEDGGRTFGPGTYIHHAPGSVHTPSSRAGCTLLVFLPRAVEPVA